MTDVRERGGEGESERGRRRERQRDRNKQSLRGGEGTEREVSLCNMQSERSPRSYKPTVTLSKVKQSSFTVWALECTLVHIPESILTSKCVVQPTVSSRISITKQYAPYC